MTDAQFNEFMACADRLGGVSFPPGFSANQADELMRHVRDVGQRLMDSGTRDTMGRTYSAYLAATCDAESMEGNLYCDTHMAVTMLCDHAKKIGNPLAHEKMALVYVTLCMVTASYRCVVLPDDGNVDDDPDVDFLERYLSEAGEINESKLRADFMRYYALWFAASKKPYSQEQVDEVIEHKLAEIRRYIAGDELEGQ